MLRFLFPRLTRSDEARGQPLFAAIVREARQPHWYRDGGITDSIDGRFAILSTLVALAAVRLEQAGPEGEQTSVALAERFIEAMDAEHRQIGLGDPTLGKTVRKLTGALARRVDLWRGAVTAADWTPPTVESLRQCDADYCAAALRRFWSGIAAAPVSALAAGDLA